jgi:hypothetical protein
MEPCLHRCIVHQDVYSSEGLHGRFHYVPVQASALPIFMIQTQGLACMDWHCHALYQDACHTMLTAQKLCILDSGYASLEISNDIVANVSCTQISAAPQHNTALVM